MTKKLDVQATSGRPGRYHLQVFDRNRRRYSTHHCDGTYDSIFYLAQAAQTAITDEEVASVLMIDTENAKKPSPVWGPENFVNPDDQEEN